MNNKEKAQEYDKMVKLIDKHYIESDGIFAKEYSKSAVLEDVLERYLNTIRQLQNKIKDIETPKDCEKCEDCDNSKTIVKLTDYFITFMGITKSGNTIHGNYTLAQTGDFNFVNIAESIFKHFNNNVETNENNQLKAPPTIMFLKDINVRYEELEKE